MKIIIITHPLGTYAGIQVMLWYFVDTVRTFKCNILDKEDVSLYITPDALLPYMYIIIYVRHSYIALLRDYHVIKCCF